MIFIAGNFSIHTDLVAKPARSQQSLVDVALMLRVPFPHQSTIAFRPLFEFKHFPKWTHALRPTEQFEGKRPVWPLSVPSPWQQVVDHGDLVVRDTRQGVGEPGVGIDGVQFGRFDQGVGDGGRLPTCF